MTTDSLSETSGSIFESLRGTRDALSVSRAFGESYEVDGVTIIPVARVGGGGGGGAGDGGPASEPSERNGNAVGDDGAEEPGQGAQGSGFGTGFGMGASPLGVYEIRDGQVDWKPAVDVNRMIRGGQFLAGLIALCVTAIIWRRT